MCKTKSCDVNKFKAVTTCHDGLTCNCPSYWNCFHLGTDPTSLAPWWYLVFQLTRRARENDGLNNLTQTVILLCLGLNCWCVFYVLLSLFCRFYCVSPNSSVILIPRETDFLWLKLICVEGKKFISQPVRWSIYCSFCTNFLTQLDEWNTFLDWGYENL